MYFEFMASIPKKKTLQELQNEIFEITKKQNQVTHWGLSKEIESKVILELEVQKADLIKEMHEKVDQLQRLAC